MQPQLQNPVLITYRNNDKASQSTHNTFLEPTRKYKEGADVVLYGQPVFYSDADPSNRDFGVSEESKGYIVFRSYDLVLNSYTISRGDHIVKIGEDTVDFWILEVRRTAFYKQHNKTLILAHFTDRKI